MPANQEITIWGIHAGKTGDADRLFLKEHQIAVGWIKMGDLGSLKPDREAFKQKVAEVYTDAKPGAIPNYAGQLYRFVHEMKPGDIVVYPSKMDRQVHIGKVEGPYRYDPKREAGYPNQRAVKWFKTVPRTHFTQGALYEIGSAMSLFQVKTYAEEFLAVLEEKAAPPVPAKDETVAYVAEDIEDTTRDFIVRGKLPVSTEYLYLLLSNVNISGYITGAAQPKVTQQNLNRIPVLVPEENIMNSFDEIVKPFTDCIHTMAKKIANLRYARNHLLPKLISGEIDLGKWPYL